MTVTKVHVCHAHSNCYKYTRVSHSECYNDARISQRVTVIKRHVYHTETIPKTCFTQVVTHYIYIERVSNVNIKDCDHLGSDACSKWQFSVQ